jgi:hypothetical protein
MSSNVEEYIRFANALASYEITCEEYIDSLNGKQTFLQDHNGNFIKHVLNRSHIKLSSYLFSSKFINFINNNDYFRERYTIEDNAICLEKPSMTPTASNIRELNCFSCLKKLTIVTISSTHTLLHCRY